MRAMDGMRRMIYGKLEKQSSLLSRGDQKGSVEGEHLCSALRDMMGLVAEKPCYVGGDGRTSMHSVWQTM